MALYTPSTSGGPGDARAIETLDADSGVLTKYGGDPSPESSCETLDVRSRPPGSACGACGRPLGASSPFMDRNYFRLLTKTLGGGKGYLIESRKFRNIPPQAFNQGYYGRFFRQGRRLGRGARGTVFLTQHVLENEALGEYAIKKIPVGDDVAWLVRFLREVHVLESLKHPNIICYKHAWLEVHQPSPFSPAVPALFILMEFANGGSLDDLITAEVLDFETLGGGGRPPRGGPPGPGRHRLPLADILYLFTEIVRGFQYLHAHRIIHRDIKPPNIVLNYPVGCFARPEVLITDFGECNAPGDLHQDDPRPGRMRTGATGTLEFVAPELLPRSPTDGAVLHSHTPATDMWSVGMILYYLLEAGGLPYADVEDVEVLRHEMLSMRRLVLPEHLLDSSPAALVDLLADLLSLDAGRRPSAGETLERLGTIYASLPVRVESSALLVPSRLLLPPAGVPDPPHDDASQLRTRLTSAPEPAAFGGLPSENQGLVLHVLILVASTLYCHPLSPCPCGLITAALLILLRKRPVLLLSLVCIYAAIVRSGYCSVCVRQS